MITKEQFAKAQDHSVLGTFVPKEDVKRFCEETIRYGFASVYVNPCDVAYAKSIVGEKAKVGTVIGFPQGANATAVKIFEGLDAIENGADELDIVINVSRLKDGDADYVKNELSEFNRAMKAKKPDAIVKVIIECYYLTHGEKITAAEIVAGSGVDYIKQSTGTTPNNSFTLGDTKLLKSIVGERVKIKSSGWIITIEDAIGSMEFGASRIGNSLGVEWLGQFDENRWYR